jgi:hypothetical protein
MEIKGQIKPESYGESDIKILVSLLAEYSEKLDKMCDRVEALKAKNNLIIVVIIICSLVNSIFFNVRSTQDLAWSNSFITSIIIIAITAISILLLVNLFHDIKRCRKLLRNMAPFCKKLERVATIISQLEDHSIGSISSRFEMDFRLTEAEQSLEHAISLGIKKK